MALLRDFQISLLNFSIAMIYIVHKMLVLLRNHLNYLRDNIFDYLFKSYGRFLLSKKKKFFFRTYNDGKPKAWRRKYN